MKNTVLAFMISLALASGGRADTVTLPGTSWDGNLANPDNWPGSTIPSEGSGDIVLSGLVGNLTLSRNLTIGGTYTFQVNGGSTVSAAFGEYSLSVPGRIAIGDGGSSNNTFDLTSGSLNGSGMIFVGRVNPASGNTLRVSNAGTSVSAGGRFIVGYNSASGNALIVTNGANLVITGSSSGSLEAGGNSSGNLVLLDQAGTVNVGYYGFVGREANACNNRMVVRNVDTAVFTKGIEVGYTGGANCNSLLVTNVAHLTTGPIVVGRNGACCTGEVYLVAAESPVLPEFKVGVNVSATNCHLLVDGAGNCYGIAGVPLSNFTLGNSGNTIELRNMTLTYGSGGTVDATSCTNSQYVISKGAAVVSTASSFKFSNCAPGFGLTIDGGRIELTNQFWISNGEYRMDVLSGGEVSCSNLYCNASDVAITVSNATIRASGDIFMPQNSIDGYVTNVVLRFAGESPRMTAYRFYQRAKNDAAIDSEDNKTGVIFDFVLPENGYEAVPLETGGIIWLVGRYCKVRVDASAYRGDRRWMPLMRSNNGDIRLRMTEADLCAGFPSSPELTVEHRIVSVEDGAKELQIRVNRPTGFSIIFR